MIQLFHPLLTLIATASDSLLAKYVLYLKNENRILRDRIPGEIHTKLHERTQPFGKVHLDYLVSEFVDYYNKHRAHSSREYLPPCCAEPPPEFETIRLDEIHCEEHLGGLIKSYERIAA
ncbi:hypothetical protein [Gimesia maris]|uniref:Integrase catalytic domain-containing protein n=1 Tax=Gimesia maris TaxID=122 RepID=A0ABX5YKK6_9PLAN|nr:hypothetical protein [Gimesia maris]EDL57123.1 hypothetical protein PM8797T_01984 [Gimesia maris DSM 8797]QDU14140.1 hypothetical protein CA11_19440 [Gimesia maris]QEG16162.1 hypothetical protein GmarT_20230 [Gimesia maris]QGQ30612.1 hypothetical protein F1729_19225 [Gimesia maris]